MKILRFKELESTQTYAKSLIPSGLPVTVVADKQTGGKGTKNRSFSSDVGGVYLTKLIFYDRFPAKNAFLVMASAAVAVCKTLESFGIKPKIKWANDIFVNDKKICGILTENGFSSNTLKYSLVGIGLNVNNVLPEELKEIGITIKEATGREFSVDEVTKKLVSELNRVSEMDEYLKRLGYMNEFATLIQGERSVKVKLLSVEKTGELVVEGDGKTRKVATGEVSLRV